MKPILLILLIATCLFGCNQRNKLNTNEQKLAAQIKAEELEKQEAKAAEDQNLPAIPDTLPPGFRFKEDRSVDPENPPVHLDVLGTRKNVRQFKLSDFATKIRYIKLETPPDSMLFYTHPKIAGKSFSLISDDKHIFVQGIYGITKFNKEGKFLEQIWKNESGITVTPRFVMTSPQEFYGVMNSDPISIFNDNLYVRFIDGESKKVRVVKKEIKDDLILNRPFRGQEELLNAIAGDRLLTIQGKRYSQRFSKIYGLSENSWAAINNTFDSAETGAQLIIFNNNGDTICTISANKTMQNWSKSLVRAGEPYTYYFKNQLTFIGQYSDTIFRIIPPNKLHPRYILDFGVQKVGFMDGLDPDSDLSEKLMLNSIFETNRFLYLRYTKNLSSPRNRKKGTVTFYNAFFIKNENKLYHSPDATPNAVNIENDIDGGISFWPKFVTPQGDMLMLITGKELKDYVGSEEFQKQEMPLEQKEKQIEMAKELNEKDKVVMIVN